MIPGLQERANTLGHGCIWFSSDWSCFAGWTRLRAFVVVTNLLPKRTGEVLVELTLFYRGGCLPVALEMRRLPTRGSRGETGFPCGSARVTPAAQTFFLFANLLREPESEVLEKSSAGSAFDEPVVAPVSDPQTANAQIHADALEPPALHLPALSWSSFRRQVPPLVRSRLRAALPPALLILSLWVRRCCAI